MPTIPWGICQEIKFSDILKNFLEDIYQPEEYKCSVSVEKEERYSWLNVSISYGTERDYKLTFHTHKVDGDAKERYQILSLPFKYGSAPQKMKIDFEDGAKIELPFVKDILSDPFASYIARLVIAQSIIEMDVDGFEEDMFEDHCHC